MAFQFQFLICHTLAQDSSLIAILWLWQVAVIQAKTILLEDWRFTPTIAPALDQSGVFPVEV